MEKSITLPNKYSLSNHLLTYISQNLNLILVRTLFSIPIRRPSKERMATSLV